MNVPLKLSVLVSVKNEALNLRRCLAQVCGWADEVVVVDSFSTDGTIGIAEQCGAKIVQFEYKGGWPKKRQWALNTYPFRNEWVLLLDADEILTDKLREEIHTAISCGDFDGFYIRYEIVFLSRRLKYGDTALWKLSLFRLGKGRFERRLEDQNQSMCDMEVHEQVIVAGRTAKLNHPVEHVNINLLDRYIEKHNQYSNWESRVHLNGSKGELERSLFGNQAQRRRVLKIAFMKFRLFPVLMFLHMYFVRLGFLDGVPGLYYACFKAVQVFHVQAKIYELSLPKSEDGSLADARESKARL